MSADRQREAQLAQITGAHEAGQEADRQLWAAIAVARARGRSWAEVGQALGGISKQAAAQRFAVLERRFRGQQLELVTEQEHEHR